MVRGELVHDPQLGSIGKVDWSTQDVWESFFATDRLRERDLWPS